MLKTSSFLHILSHLHSTVSPTITRRALSAPSTPTPTTMETRLLQTLPGSISFSSDLTRPEPTISDPATEEAILDGARRLKAGELVAFPSETVYGLGANALNGEAVGKIYQAKGRPSDNPLIIHVSSLEMLHSVLPPSALPLSPLYAYLTTHHWPGPLTLLFPTNSSLIPSQTTASLPTVAIRFPSHPVARALIHHASVPLAAPSANSSGRPSPTRGEHVLHDLKGRVGLILDGGSCEVGLESTVVDGLEWDKTGDLKVLRPGGVTVEDLEEALRAVEKSAKREKKGRVLVYSKDFKDEKLVEAPTTPGMKYMHYTPSIPVYLLSPRSTSSSSSSSAALPTPISAIYDYLPQSPSPSSISSSSPLASSSPKPPSSSPTLSQRKVGLMLYTSSPLQTNIASSSSSPSSSSSSSISSFSSPNVIFHHHPLGSLSFPSEAANRLFDGLLQLERQGCEAIFIEEGDETGVGRAVAERVGKAIGGAKGRIEVSLEGERLESDAM